MNCNRDNNENSDKFDASMREQRDSGSEHDKSFINIEWQIKLQIQPHQVKSADSFFLSINTQNNSCAESQFI